MKAGCDGVRGRQERLLQGSCCCAVTVRRGRTLHATRPINIPAALGFFFFFFTHLTGDNSRVSVTQGLTQIHSL